MEPTINREDTIDRVHHLANQENQPKMKRGQPFFEWEPGLEILDDPEGICQQEEVNKGASNNDKEINRILRYNWALVSDDDTSWNGNNDDQTHDEDGEESRLLEDDSDKCDNCTIENIQEDSSVESTSSDNDENSSKGRNQGARLKILKK